MTTGSRILVVGAGATGGYFGARLAQAGRDVTFAVRPGRAAQLREGLRLSGADDEIVVPQLVAMDELDASYDVVLLAVKATGLGPALTAAAPALAGAGAIVPFLNGMAHLDRLRESYGDATLGGVVRIAATLGPAGEVVRLAPFADLLIGEIGDGRPDRLDALAELLDVEGYELATSSRIVADMWAKWVFIASTGVLNCLGQGSVGEIAATVSGRRFAGAVVAEADSVASAAGFPTPEQTLAASLAFVTQAGSTFTSSMYRDLRSGLPTEVEHILGDLVARGDRLGVPTPLLTAAATQLRVHEERLVSG